MLRADAAADSADAAVRRVWRQVLALLREPDLHWSTAYHRARDIFAGLVPTVAGEIAGRLAKDAAWGHRTAKANLTATLPQSVIDYAAAQRAITESHHASADHAGDGRREEDGGAAGRCVREDGVSVHGSGGAKRAGASSGGIHLHADPSQTILLEAAPTVGDILFPGYTSAEVAHVVYSSGWEDRLRAGTKLAAPDRLASVLASSLAAGKNSREVAQDLAPHVQGVQATARRIARTESMRVAQDSQMRCHDQLGDLVVGYQVHATLDQHTRPWHAARSGRVYYLHPRPGQPGPDQQPNPPEEPRDPRERPAKAPQIAYNCRCYLSPVLREPGSLPTSFTPATTPDPLVYHDWFLAADEKRRRLAVGARRYSAVQAVAGKNIQWADFLDPKTGDLLPLAALKAETPAQRIDRLAKVRAMLGARRVQAQQVSQQGFLTGVGGKPAPVAAKPPAKPKLTPQAPPAPKTFTAAADRIKAAHGVPHVLDKADDPETFGGQHATEADKIAHLETVGAEIDRMKAAFPTLKPPTHTLYATKDERGHASIDGGKPKLSTKSREYTEAEWRKIEAWEKSTGKHWGTERRGSQIADNYRHELGHNLTTPTVLVEWEAAKKRGGYDVDWFKRNVSEYAGKNEGKNAYEEIAEVFGMMTRAEYVRGTLPAGLENVVYKYMLGM